MAEWRAIHQPTKISHAIWFKFKVPLRLSKYQNQKEGRFTICQPGLHMLQLSQIYLFSARGVSASPKSPQRHLPLRTGLSVSYQPPPKAAESTVQTGRLFDGNIMQVTNVRHICNFKFSSGCINKTNKKSNMKLTHLDNIFYLTQYIHTNLQSILKLLSYLTFFFHTQCLIFSLYFIF